MSRVLDHGEAAVARILLAGQRRLRILLRCLIVAVLVLTVVAGLLAWVAWPRLTMLANQAEPGADSGSAQEDAEAAPPAGEPVPSSGDTLVVARWATWMPTPSGAAFAVQVMLRRESAAGPGTLGLWLLYPEAGAPPSATVTVTYLGAPYKATLTGPLIWQNSDNHLNVYTDLTCGTEVPMTCSGTRAVWDDQASSPEQITPAYVANGLQSPDGEMHLFSVAAVVPAVQADRCLVMVCG